MVGPDLVPKREATFCWERGRPVRTEREARKRMIGYQLLTYLAKKHARLRRGAGGTTALPAIGGSVQRGKMHQYQVVGMS
jgi:hypothetical protein